MIPALRKASNSRLDAVNFLRSEGALSYTILYNLLNFPAGAVTVSTVTEEDEAQLRHYRGVHGDMWDRLFVKVRFHSARPLR